MGTHVARRACVQLDFKPIASTPKLSLHQVLGHRVANLIAAYIPVPPTTDHVCLSTSTTEYGVDGHDFSWHGDISIHMISDVVEFDEIVSDSHSSADVL